MKMLGVESSFVLTKCQMCASKGTFALCPICSKDTSSPNFDEFKKIQYFKSVVLLQTQKRFRMSQFEELQCLSLESFRAGMSQN